MQLPFGAKTINIDEKEIIYFNDTHFLVQVGHGKGSYKTKHDIIGQPVTALSIYNGINIGNGFKKRLVLKTSIRREVLAKQN